MDFQKINEERIIKYRQNRLLIYAIISFIINFILLIIAIEYDSNCIKKNVWIGLDLFIIIGAIIGILFSIIELFSSIIIAPLVCLKGIPNYGIDFLEGCFIFRNIISWILIIFQFNWMCIGIEIIITETCNDFLWYMTNAFILFLFFSSFVNFCITIVQIYLKNKYEI